MVQRLLYDSAKSTTDFLWLTYSNSQRYCVKQLDPSLTRAILGLEYNKEERLKNEKVYLMMKKYIEKLEKGDKYPQGLSLREQNTDIDKECCRIALSRGPFATNYLMALLSQQSELDPYNKLITSNKLLKNHGQAFLYGLYVIILTGSQGQTLMKKKFLDEISVETTKFSLFLLMLRYLIEEIQVINTELLFELPRKESLGYLIAGLTSLHDKLNKG